MKHGILLLIIALAQISLAFTTFCKCDCEINYQIFNLKDASLEDSKLENSCKSCSLEFCLAQSIELCTDTDENKEFMTAVCFRKYGHMKLTTSTTHQLLTHQQRESLTRTSSSYMASLR
ncbi:hypothetical protein CANARDRAFT_164402 [[Candida] arabinofermentans NRRL YB-2248]|uniref:Uncharacterized protein n=1 Tax=[Candida] arabinofermentans NRRL YB-2248 TaxID=983967 RepID=A0A1E4T0K4_9ASCO|nr:hypothetical protein CANARDRAFT_164402 [[Candida] arabinofermentans NRRL YB-2248]